MEYIRVKWKHTSSDEPVLLYSELDMDRYELRKVEIYLDGRKGYASATEEKAGTRLGDQPVPPLAEIALDDEFEPVEISKEEFETVWNQRSSGTS